MTVIVRESQQAGPSSRESLVEVRGLTVAYGDVVAVDGIDLTIGAGEIIGLAGESGCGKTTVANSLMQILRPPAHITGGCATSSASTSAGSARIRTSFRAACGSG